MLKLRPEFTGNIIGLTAGGQITKDDYEKVLIPAVKAALEKHDKVRIYYELDDSFSGMDVGAMWEDFTFGMGHLTRWEKVAVITDVSWLAGATNAFRFLMPCPVKVFPLAEAKAAHTWIEDNT